MNHQEPPMSPQPPPPIICDALNNISTTELVFIKSRLTASPSSESLGSRGLPLKLSLVLAEMWRRNAATPLLCLPTEIICYIFHLLQSHRSNDWLRLMLGCQQLHEIALAHSPLWGLVYVNSRANQNRMDWARICLERVKSCVASEVHWVFNGPSATEEDYMTELCSCNAGTLLHFSSLQDNSNGDDLRMQAVQRFKLHLYLLTIEFRDRHLASQFLDSKYTSLTELNLSLHHTHMDAFPDLPNLTRFSLSVTGHPREIQAHMWNVGYWFEQPRRFADILLMTPRLTHLSITVYGPTSFHFSSPENLVNIPHVSLPFLQTLKLRGDRDVLSALMSIIPQPRQALFVEDEHQGMRRAAHDMVLEYTHMYWCRVADEHCLPTPSTHQQRRAHTPRHAPIVNLCMSIGKPFDPASVGAEGKRPCLWFKRQLHPRDEVSSICPLNVILVPAAHEVKFHFVALHSVKEQIESLVMEDRLDLDVTGFQDWLHLRTTPLQAIVLKGWMESQRLEAMRILCMGLRDSSLICEFREE
jgi:hypothetical protein